ncbi:MAG TPA: SMI1/KNR4 family protein [Steroidobacteraceae bacterium]|nr:SMI1/KNR4 family protein [Steroidobacteraceae bacterium]
MSIFTYLNIVERVGDESLRVRARITFKRAEEGGRTEPVCGQYHPNHNFGKPNDIVWHIGQIEIPTETVIEPGEVKDLEVAFPHVRGLKEQLTIGRQWRIQELQKHVATGEVLELLGDWSKHPADPPRTEDLDASDDHDLVLPPSYVEFSQSGGLEEAHCRYRILNPAEIRKASRNFLYRSLLPFAINSREDYYCWFLDGAVEPAVVFYDRERQKYVVDSASFHDWLDENRI